MIKKMMKPASELISPHDMKKWPKLCSVKLDGIRARTSDEGVLSNSLKQIPNLYVQKMLKDLPEGLDGELTLRGKAGLVYDNNQSAFMSRGGEPDFVLNVFDYMVDGKFKERLEAVRALALHEHAHVRYLPQRLKGTPELAIAWYELARQAGYEGLILRDPDAQYKHGRSTLKQEWALKMKPFDPDEAIVTDMTELMHNENEQTTNEMGNAVRSSHQDNKVPGNKLGALVCSYNGNEFRIGTGFTDAQRIMFWQNRHEYIGSIARFKHQGITKAGVPRGPAVFLGWRDALDMTEVPSE